MQTSYQKLILFLFLGIYLGVLFVKSEVISWYRIFEMFRFESFHMYGVIFMALFVSSISLFLIQKFHIRDFNNNEIILKNKEFIHPYGIRYICGGILFGIGWAITGACPGPMFAVLGYGVPMMIIPIISALFGTWCYAYVKDRLVH